MKSKNIGYLIAAFFLSLMLASCSEKIEDGIEPIYNPEGATPVRLNIDNQAVNNELTYTLYLFRKGRTEAAYKYLRTVTLLADNTDTLSLLTGDLYGASYKFLFTCTTAEPEIATVNSSNSSLNGSNTWSDVRIRQNADLLSKDNYYKIVDKTGEELLDELAIHATLDRMVGQLVFDIYRADTDINSPTDIVSSAVESVLDRVYQIDIEYTNMSKEFYFNDSNDLLVSVTEGYIQEIKPALSESLTLSLPQEEEFLELYNENIRGAVRIKGLYGLPAESNVSVKLTFYYYDDTPMCGNIEDTHSHSAEDGCFKAKTLVLNIPQNNASMEYLKIIPNMYTVNKAGIKLDRIIDLSVPGSFGFNTEWANGN